MFSSAVVVIMRPFYLGGGRILRRTLSVRLSVCLSVCLSVRPVIVAIGNVFSSTASVTDVLFGTHWGHPYFSARTEGRISYGHLGRTDSCCFLCHRVGWRVAMRKSVIRDTWTTQRWTSQAEYRRRSICDSCASRPVICSTSWKRWTRKPPWCRAPWRWLTEFRFLLSLISTGVWRTGMSTLPAAPPINDRWRCRQSIKYVLGYRSRTRTPNLTLNPNPITYPNPNPKNKRKQNDTWIKFNIELLYLKVNFLGQAYNRNDKRNTYGYSRLLVVLLISFRRLLEVRLGPPKCSKGKLLTDFSHAGCHCSQPTHWESREGIFGLSPNLACGVDPRN